MKFDIWIEGYCATGESGTAQLMASNVEGETFTDAVMNWYNSNPEEIEKAWGCLDKRRIYNEDDMSEETYLSFWGCRVFPTEAEARESFG